MTKYIEFRDEDYFTSSAVDRLNHYIKNFPNETVEIVGYQVVRYEGINKERTYILAKVTE